MMAAVMAGLFMLFAGLPVSVAAAAAVALSIAELFEVFVVLKDKACGALDELRCKVCGAECFKRCYPV